MANFRDAIEDELHAGDSVADHDARSRRSGAPGKSTLTSRLGASPASIARAVVAQLRAADAPPLERDDLGGPNVPTVAAEGTAGGGGPLPFLDEIQRAFGHHDVTGVRAHVGGTAAHASAAMGARAYAFGDDVAFASAPDLHLAAHEAAHVVQQRAGVRLSGGVGRAGDEYERHADAVAAGVVRGDFVQDLLGNLAHRGPAGGPAVQRNVGDLPSARSLETTAVDQDARTEAAIEADVEGGRPSDRVLAMSNVGDVVAAQAEVERIRAVHSDLTLAIDRGFAEDEALVENTCAIAALESYVFSGEGQTQSIVGFQGSYQRLLRDYDRFAGQIDAMRASRRGTPMRAQEGGAELGRVTVAAADVDPTSTRAPTEGQGQLQGQADSAQSAMLELGTQVPQLWSDALEQREAVQAAAQAMASGLTPRQDSAAVAAYRQLQEKVQRIASLASAVTQVAAQVASAYVGGAVTPAATSATPARVATPVDRFRATPPSSSGEPSDQGEGAGAVSAIGDGVADLVGHWTERIVELAYADELDAARRAAEQAATQEQQAQIQSQARTISAANIALRSTLQQYLTTVRRFELAKRAYRLAVRRSARVQDPSGRRAAVLGEVTAESGAFLAQCDSTIALGEQLQAQGQDVAQQRSAMHRGEGVRWNRPRRERRAASSGWHWTVERVLVDLVHAPERSTYTNTGEQADATVAESLTRLRAMRASVQGFHGETAAPLGLATGREQ